MLILNSKNELQRIGAYQLDTLLGVGKHYEVYNAKHFYTQESVALRKLLDPAHRYGFFKEVQKLKLLDNRAFMLPFYGAFSQKDYFFTLAPKASKSLATTRLESKEALVFLRRMVDILKYLQTFQVVHNNIKPENIVLYKREYYLIDFYEADFYESQFAEYIKSDGSIAAPEALRGQRYFKSDIYALGCTLYKLLFGNSVHAISASDSFIHKAYKHIYASIEFPFDIDPILQTLLIGMLEKEPKKRFTLEQVEAVLEGKHDSLVPKKYVYEEQESDFARLSVLAKEGFVFAQFKLATLLAQMAAFKEAIVWYEKAIAHGSTRAMNNLGLLYEQGKGVKQDIKKAFYYYQKAAVRKNEHALFNLGRCYEHAIGVQQDLSKARLYYKKAAILGNKKALQRAS